MGLVEGTVWIGGNETPPAYNENDNIWWRWNTQSQNPCAECARRNGKSSPVRLPKPHPGCSCTQTEDWRICEFKRREQAGEEEHMEIEKAGELAPGASRSFSHSSNFNDTRSLSVSNLGFSGSTGGSETESTSIQNTSDENAEIFRKFTITTTYYHDHYECVGSYDVVLVKKIVTKFEGIFRGEDLIEFVD
ncbi:MAG: hypothetical protein EP338_13800 [Bacteroidetes bacterium]|nr:MAG: hypothetical protein EP338_13800 [Bacteroidota bacterium]